MTYKEAKEIFLNRGFVNGFFDGDEWRQSIVVISKWLEREPCKDCIKIPEGATNGDIIKAIFPNISVYEHENGATYSINNEYNFNSTWWNSPYGKEQE